MRAAHKRNNTFGSVHLQHVARNEVMCNGVCNTTTTVKMAKLVVPPDSGLQSMYLTDVVFLPQKSL